MSYWMNAHCGVDKTLERRMVEDINKVPMIGTKAVILFSVVEKEI